MAGGIGYRPLVWTHVILQKYLAERQPLFALTIGDRTTILLIIPICCSTQRLKLKLTSTYLQYHNSDESLARARQIDCPTLNDWQSHYSCSVDGHLQVLPTSSRLSNEDSSHYRNIQYLQTAGLYLYASRVCKELDY